MVMLFVAGHVDITDSLAIHRGNLNREAVILSAVLASDRLDDRMTIADAAVGHHHREVGRQRGLTVAKGVRVDSPNEPIGEELVQPLDLFETATVVHRIKRTTGREESECATTAMGIDRADSTCLRDHYELTHHAGVLMFQNVAVEHVGVFRVGEVTEMSDDPHRFARHDQHGVFPACLAICWW